MDEKLEKSHFQRKTNFTIFSNSDGIQLIDMKPSHNARDVMNYLQQSRFTKTDLWQRYQYFIKKTKSLQPVIDIVNVLDYY